MDSLLNSVLLNAVVAAGLALMVWLVGMAPAIRQRPSLRHGLWLVVLLKFVTPPLFTMPMLPAWLGVLQASVVAESEGPLLSLESTAHSESFEQRLELPSPWSIPWTVAALMISSLGTLAILGFVLWQVWALRRALMHGATDDPHLMKIASKCAVSFQMENAPSVMVLDANISPLLWVRSTGPLIVIPRRLADLLTEEQLTCVLSHEIAHYQRRDHFTNALSLFIATVCWWNPVVWWARRELRMTQEVCCDALVISRTPGARRTYAQTLFQTLEFLQAEQSFLPALSSGFGGKSLMERRFEMIANPRVNHRLSWWCFALLLLATAALPMIPALRAAEDKPVPKKVTPEKPVQEEAAADGVTGGASAEDLPGSSDRITINGVQYQRVPTERKAGTKDQNRTDAALDAVQSDSRIVRLNLRFDESRRAEMKYLELYISTDSGKTWKLAAANTPDRSQFDHLVPQDGTYWFGLRVTYRNGFTSPPKETTIVPTIKVRVVTTQSGAAGGVGGEGAGLGSGILGEPVEKSGSGVRSRNLGEPVGKSGTGVRSRNLGEPVEKSDTGVRSRNLGEPVEKSDTGVRNRNLGEPVEKSDTGVRNRNLGEPVEKSGTGVRSRNSGGPGEQPGTGVRSRNP